MIRARTWRRQPLSGLFFLSIAQPLTVVIDRDGKRDGRRHEGRDEGGKENDRRDY